MRKVHVIFDNPTYVAKTKAQISFTVTAKLICAFVFAYADNWFFHGTAHFQKHAFAIHSIFSAVKNDNFQAKHIRIVHVCQERIYRSVLRVTLVSQGSPSDAKQ